MQGWEFWTPTRPPLISLLLGDKGAPRYCSLSSLHWFYVWRGLAWLLGIGWKSCFSGKLPLTLLQQDSVWHLVTISWGGEVQTPHVVSTDTVRVEMGGPYLNFSETNKSGGGVRVPCHRQVKVKILVTNLTFADVGAVGPKFFLWCLFGVDNNYLKIFYLAELPFFLSFGWREQGLDEVFLFVLRPLAFLGC